MGQRLWLAPPHYRVSSELPLGVSKGNALLCLTSPPLPYESLLDQNPHASLSIVLPFREFNGPHDGLLYRVTDSLLGTSPPVLDDDAEALFSDSL